jgi:hypothetical protein
VGEDCDSVIESDPNRKQELLQSDWAAEARPEA